MFVNVIKVYVVNIKVQRTQNNYIVKKIILKLFKHISDICSFLGDHLMFN